MKMDCTTEKYAIECEKNELWWHEQYDMHEKDISDRVDELIEKNNYQELCELINDIKIFQIFKDREWYVWIKLICHIYLREKETTIDNHIFNGKNNVQHIIENIDTIKFYIWRFEFAGDINAIDELIAYVEELNISIDALAVIAGTAALDYQLVYMQLTSRMIEAKNFRGAIVLLKECIDYLPENKEVRKVYDDLTGIIRSRMV